MTCKECNRLITSHEKEESEKALNVSLCDRHLKLIERVMTENNTPKEAIMLFYALKAEGVNPMLEWWDGYKTIDVAISRVKLNIIVETHHGLITEVEAIQQLEEAMKSFKNGFTTLRIPAVLVKYYLQDTVQNILGIIEGLRSNLKVI